MFSWKLSISASGPGRALSGKNLVRKQGRALGSVSGHLYMTCERPCKCFGDPFEKQNTLISQKHILQFSGRNVLISCSCILSMKYINTFPQA